MYRWCLHTHHGVSADKLDGQPTEMLKLLQKADAEDVATDRGGKGILTMSLGEKTGDIVDAQIVSPEDRLLIMTREGITIHLRVDDIRSLSRNTQGVRAINVAEDDRVASVERMIDGKLPAEEVVP